MGSIWTLLLPPLAARVARFQWPGRITAPGLTLLDALLAVLLGICIAPVAAVWLAPFTVPGSRALGSPDFGEYCWHVGLYVLDALHEWGVNRSKLAGLPAGLLAKHFGVLDGLLLNAIGSLAVVVGAVYLWARALHGRAAGIAAAVLLAAVGPLVALGRMVTFYPTVTAGLALASAGAACALRWRTVGTVALAGIGAGIALLIDARGLLWALPAVGLGALACVVGSVGRPWTLPLRCAALVLPLVLSHQLGSWAYEPDSRSLESQVAIYDELVERGVPVPVEQPGLAPGFQYIWGHSDIRNIPYTLGHLRQESDYVPEWYHQRPEVREGWRRSGKPWVVPVAISVLVALWGLRRRPWLVVALVGSVFPFLVSMQGAVVMKTSNLRFVGSAMVFVPVVLGVAFGVLSDGSLRRRGPRTDAPGRVVPLAVLFLVTLGAVLGVPPTWLSPVASWREPWPSSESSFQTAMLVRDGVHTTQDAGMRMCVVGLKRVDGDGRLTGMLPGGGTEVTPWVKP